MRKARQATFPSTPIFKPKSATVKEPKLPTIKAPALPKMPTPKETSVKTSPSPKEALIRVITARSSGNGPTGAGSNSRVVTPKSVPQVKVGSVTPSGVSKF